MQIASSWNIFKLIELKGQCWVSIAQNRNKWKCLLHLDMEISFSKTKNLLDTLCKHKLLNRTPFHDIRPTSVVQHSSVIRLIVSFYQLNRSLIRSRPRTRMAVTWHAQACCRWFTSVIRNPCNTQWPNRAYNTSSFTRSSGITTSC